MGLFKLTKNADRFVRFLNEIIKVFEKKCLPCWPIELTLTESLVFEDEIFQMLTLHKMRFCKKCKFAEKNIKCLTLINKNNILILEFYFKKNICIVCNILYYIYMILNSISFWHFSFVPFFYVISNAKCLI